MRRCAGACTGAAAHPFKWQPGYALRTSIPALAVGRGETMSQSWPLAWLALLVMPLLAVAAVVMYLRGSARGTVQVLHVAGSAFLFAVLGPPLGALLLGVPAVVQMGGPDAGTTLLFLVAMSYVPGFIPALVGGACMGLLRQVLGPWARVGASALVCALAAVAFGLGALGLGMASAPMMGGLGGASGALLEGGWLWWARRRRRRAAAVVS